MTKKFLRTTQVFIFFNLICQLFWVAHLSFPKTIRLYFEQLEVVLFTVGLVYLLTGIFIGIYLFKMKFKLTLIGLILNATFYSFLLIVWYQLIQFKITSESYNIVYYGHLLVSFVYGLTLIISVARNKIWLKRLGIIVMSLCLVNCLYKAIPELSQIFFLQKLQLVIGFAGGIISICWIMNFQREIESLPIQNESVIDIP